MGEFRGVYPAIITPMTAEGQLNEAAFREVMEFNIQSGVHGFWIAGGAGESVLLDDEENFRLAEIAADQAKGRVKNIMHVGAPTTERAARMAEHAAKAGVDAICSIPPIVYKQNDEGIVEHYKVVAAAGDLPFFAYNVPGMTGVEITPELMLKIRDGVPQLTGLKNSGLFPNNRAFGKMGFDCFVGNSPLMLPALTIGATGCVDGPPGLAPELWVEIWNRYNDGDLRGAQAAQDKASEVVSLVYSFGASRALKALLSERLGVDCGGPRRPALPLTSEERAAVLKKGAELGLTKISVNSSV